MLFVLSQWYVLAPFEFSRISCREHELYRHMFKRDDVFAYPDEFSRKTDAHKIHYRKTGSPRSRPFAVAMLPQYDVKGSVKFASGNSTTRLPRQRPDRAEASDGCSIRWQTRGLFLRKTALGEWMNECPHLVSGISADVLECTVPR